MLFYGVQTWALTGKKLERDPNYPKRMRSLLGIRLADKINLGKIYEKTKARKAPVVARTLKFKYAGYMVRDNKNKWNGLPIGVKGKEAGPI